MIGKTISHYKIIEELGAGGMGIVYKAKDLKLDRFVALKFLPQENTRDAGFKARFINEARAASALQHNTICTIHEIDETEQGQIFICMDYYQGETLSEKIKQKPLPVAETINISIQIAHGLQSAHDREIIHRDIKPANIIITTEGQVKILDFGLSKFLGRTRVTKEGCTTGTIAYMSPEQTKGEPVDHRSDIWALGIVIYEMITGRLPFGGDYDQAVVYSILNENPEEINTTRSEIPTELVTVVEKTLNKDPKRRYKDIDQLLPDLLSIQKKIESKQEMEDKKVLPSIAVLPFVNMSKDEENEYFSDGMAEDLINALSKIKDFRVAARTSSFSFKDEKTDVRDIGRKLNVETILEGSVRKSGDRLRITAQLVEAKNGYHLWSEQYDRVVTDVFDIQDEITLAIVNALKIELLAGENQAVTKRYTENVEAYNLYLQGRYYWNKMSIDGFQKAIEIFQDAIKIDPAYARAYAGLADSYIGLGDAGLSAISPKEAFSTANIAVKKAMEIDNALAEAHASLGHLRMHALDWSGAEREFNTAIELKPNYATTYHMSSFNFAIRNRHDEAINNLMRAMKLDPVSLGIITDLGVLYYFSRQYDKAISQYRKVLKLDPQFVRAYVTLGSAYGQKGLYREAINMVQKAIDLSGDRAKIAALGRIHALSGEKEKALAIVDELKRLSKQRYISPYCLALIYACLGENDCALELLQEAFSEHVSELIYLKVDPYLDNLRLDERFNSLLLKVNL